MERQFSSYETLFIVDLALGEEGVKAIVDKFIGMISDAGNITAVNEWGKRRLAYPINDKNEGYYVLVNFTAPQSFITELERIYSITEGLMRSMVVKGEYTVADVASATPSAASDVSSDVDEDAEAPKAEVETVVEPEAVVEAGGAANDEESAE